MVERFKNWLNIFPEFKLGTNVRSIFEDAIKCYIHNIPRPALMLSYIAFLESIRDKILLSSKPQEYKEGRWNKLLHDITQKDKWEEELMSCLVTDSRASQGAKKAIFDLSSSLRDEIKYWKGRRNDCAHYKDNEIGLSHVTSFWMFVMSNYCEFTPIGSISEIAKDFDIHYDISQTPPNKDIRPLYNRLKLIIKSENDLHEFYRLIQTPNREQRMLIANKLSHEPEPLRTYAISFLSSSEQITIPYLLEFPNELGTVIGNKPQIIRKLWHDEQYAYKFYSLILKNSLIPAEELEESMKRYLGICYGTYKDFHCEKSDVDVLLKNGIYDVFIKNYLSEDFFSSNYEVINFRCRFYENVLVKLGLNDIVIEALTRAFSFTNYPYTLRNHIRRCFVNNILSKDKYIESITRQGLEDSLDVKNIEV